MIPVNIYMPENRLAKVLDGPKTVEFDLLVQASDKRVQALAPVIRTYVEQQIDRLTGIQNEGEASMFCRCDEVADAAMNIAELAGASGLEAMGDVARGIRAMTDNLRSSGLWHSDALAVHIAALAMLDGVTVSAKDADVIVNRLRKMRSSLCVVE